MVPSDELDAWTTSLLGWNPARNGEGEAWEENGSRDE